MSTENTAPAPGGDAPAEATAGTPGTGTSGAGISGAGRWAFDFTGKRVVITGGSRGMGFEMARAFSSLGAEVAIASRKIASCEDAAARITTETGGRVHPYALQAADWDQCTEFSHRVWDELGGVDVLVNNAGSSPLYDSVAGISEELYDKVIGLNLKGPFRLSALLGERMAERGGGSIVNISSIAALHPKPSTVPYSAAKAGLNATTIALAHAYGPSVRVNAVVPGTFLTDIAKHWDMEAFGRRAKSFAAERGGEPDEIVGAVLYLASSLASYTTGALLTVDGGAPS
ncbi:SDR family oxidoreductase [Nocardia zapadnayensis]|nr:SDR family oxidoreductase [Nocardia zapadnayensis]MCX0276926.1 SDR family oxidoreductase [Nocardia zapadnayensis]